MPPTEEEGKAEIRKLLETMTSEYGHMKELEALSQNSAEECRDYCVAVLNGEMERLDSQGLMDSPEYGQYEFTKRMLDNGWTVSDMLIFSDLYERINTSGNADNLANGQKLIEELSNKKIETVGERFEAVGKIADYTINASKLEQDWNQDMIPKLNELMNSKLVYSEFPKDKEFEHHFEKEGAFNPRFVLEKKHELENREALIVESIKHNARPQKEKEQIRELGDYVMSELSEEILEQGFVNLAHKRKGITKSNRQAIKEVYGEEVYDSIDEKHIGTAEERTVPIHHARGNKLLREGKAVIEFELAGTGFTEARKEYTGHHGGYNVSNVDRDVMEKARQAQFGDRVKKDNGEEYEYIRCKDQTQQVGDTTYKKSKYSISGPNLFNVGTYSIENNRVRVRDFAKKEIKEHLEKWAKGEEKPHDICINISGHSRGAVCVEESVRYIYDWMKDYSKKNPDMQQYMKYVKFETMQRDPVPGFGTSVRLGKKDLRDVPNLNATVFCTMASEYSNMIFPLQNVRGAKRIIVGTTEHGMELSSIDSSQRNRKEDGKAHQAGFFDAETGEYYRGTGVAEMPEGVFIADDRYNVVRLTSYSQIGKLIDSVHEGASKQGQRVEAVHDMVRNWFVDNTLSISYGSETERMAVKDKASDAMDRIMRSDVSRLKPIKAEIKNIDKLMSEGASNEELKAANEKLVKVCKSYMAKTSIPAEGDSAYRMNLVSDLMTATERENNYIERGLDKRPEINKEGYIDRQIARETKRIDNAKEIKSMMKDAAKACSDTLKELEGTRKGKTNSLEYESFVNALRAGATLSNNRSVEDYMRVMNKLKVASDEYVKTHSGLFSPTSADGKKRLKFVDAMSKYADNNLSVMDKKSRNIGDKSASIDSVAAKHANNVESLNVRKKNGNAPLTEGEIAKDELAEKIRLESERYDRLRRTKGKSPLAMNDVNLVGARLVYLKTVQEAAKESGYANPSEIRRNLDDNVINMAAGPIAKSKGFAEVVKKNGSGKVKAAFEDMNKKPVKQNAARR